MKVFSRALSLIGFRASQRREDTGADYQELMENALRRVRLAELQIREATTVEDLDVGRSSLLVAWAEVQQLVRTAKRDRGIALRPIEETEERHRKMRDFMNPLKRTASDAH